MEITTIYLDNIGLSLHESLNNTWLTASLCFLVQASTPRVDNALFGESQSVIITTCHLLDLDLQRWYPNELVDVDYLQIWYSQFTVES